MSWCTVASVRRHALVRYSFGTLYVAVPAVMMSLFLYPRVLMAVDEKKVETIAKQIAQQRTPQVCMYINSFDDR
jgi:hypothetical protein